MRVLHVTHQYRPAIGGSERYFADLSEELSRRGHQVDVATTRSRAIESWRSELPTFERLDGVNVRRFRSLQRGRLGWHALRFGASWHRASGSVLVDVPILFGTGPLAPGLAWHVWRYGGRYDLVHIQTLPYAHVVYAYACARAAGRPVVVTPHIHVDQEDTFDLASFNAVLRGCDVVIAVSKREVPYLLARGVRSERIVLAGNGVRLNSLPKCEPVSARKRLGLPPDAFVLLFLGRKESYKGLPTLVRAFSRSRSAHPSLSLISAGPPTPTSQALRRDYAGLPGWTDLDTVDHAQKVDLLNASDVLLLPSTGEAFGIVFLEAWAVGKPVVGARAGAIPWVIDDGRDGFLVAPDDDRELAQVIDRLARSPELCRRLGAAGEAKVRQHFTVERIADRIEDAYHQALAHAGCR
jgi:glycosyltransferase involved in cell wall biosynthesis